MIKMIFSMIGCLLSVNCFANDCMELDDKFYVSPGSVYVAPNAIYVNINGNLFPVRGIVSDENGVYIQDDKCVMERPFYCLKCGKTHTLRQGCPK